MHFLLQQLSPPEQIPPPVPSGVHACPKQFEPRTHTPGAPQQLSPQAQLKFKKRGQHNLSHRHSHYRSKLDENYSLLLSHIPEQPTTIHMSESTPHSLNDPSRFETWKLPS